MASETRVVQFAGLDPVPIRIALAEEADDDAIFAAAGMPSSIFMQTVRPYRLHQPDANTYELVMGPEGFGAVLLEALQWLAHVAAAGIVGSIASAQVAAFVAQYLEHERTDWRFEELTEHASAFINDRYRRAAEDHTYRQGLENKRHETDFAALMVHLQQWVV